MDINYELYKVFYYVATTLSFSEASKQLFISQSAVSQSIKVLEKKLEQPLFIRSTKKVRLTSQGEILLKHVEPAMNLIKKGQSQIFETNSLKGGQLRIGASDTICRYFLVPFLSQFHKDYPNIHIKVLNQTSIECAKFLENGEVDCIITNFPNSGFKKYDTYKKIKKFSDIFLASKTYFPLENTILTLNELQKHPILMLEKKSTTSEFLHSVFQKYQLDLVPEIELSSNDLLIDLAKIGLGIAFIPDFCVPKDDDLFIVNIDVELPNRDLVVAYNEDIPLSPAAKSFVNMLSENI
jgi:Transcriptional regulator